MVKSDDGNNLIHTEYILLDDLQWFNLSLCCSDGPCDITVTCAVVTLLTTPNHCWVWLARPGLKLSAKEGSKTLCFSLV